MKTPKPTQGKEKNLATPAGGKITKNKAKGKNPSGNNINAVKAKLGLQKAKDTVKVQDGKNLQKKNKMTNKVFNGKGSPKALNGSAVPNAKGGKKRKSDEGVKPEVVGGGKKSKKSKGALKSPEVQLGLKIEKMLESPKNDGPGKKNKKKGKGAANAEQNKPEVQTPVAGSPGKGRRRRKGKGKKISEGGSPVVVPPTGNQQKKDKQQVAPKPKQQAAPKPKQQAAPQPKPDWDAPVPLGPFPSRPNTENAVKALLKHMKEQKAKKPALLDEFEPLLLCVEFFKKPAGRKLQRVVLPHHILGNNPDIIFVVMDNKKAKRDHDESIETHKELFKSRGVNNITEIIPWRKLCYEYTQFEEKRKLANRADAFLIDSKLSHRWPAIMNKKFFKKKAPIPVRVDKTSDLKKSIEIALRKVTVILGTNSLGVTPQFGNTKLNVKALVDNLITVVTVLCDESKYPGGQANIRQINIRGVKSESFPIFVSTASPNSVETPKGNKKKKREVVEGEVTTAGVTVAVHPGGRVQIKSRDKDDDEDEHDTSPKKKQVKGEVHSDDDLEDDSEGEDDEDDDSEIDSELLEKFKKANKVSEDESSDEEEIEKAEQQFLLALRKQQDAVEAEAQAKSKKAGKKAPVVEEGSSDEEDDDDDDDSDVPDLIPVKKSKPQTQQPKKGTKQAPRKPAQNGVGKVKPGQGKPPGKQAQSPKGGAGKKGPQGGKGNAKKGNNKGSPKAQQRYFNKGGKKK